MIEIRSEKEIAVMKKAGSIVSEVLNGLKNYIKPGIKTIELDLLSERLIKKLGGRPAFKDYKGYPANICTSVNNVIVHGIPGERVLSEGDIITVDIGVETEGYFGDGAYTYTVGRTDGKANKLIDVTRTALDMGIRKARAGNKVSAISCAVQNFVESNGFSIIKAFVGHGIGTKLHEPPEIPNFGKPDTGAILESGMVLAIEPMVSAGGYEIDILQDGWTAVTLDKSLAAHFEHTVAITNNGAEILTLCQKKNL
ncbi:MAG: type I methionyl aminopeptidase [Candidatus Omnitrophota bacterium]|nr:type I methionyl aminopeptidase [Candidatus Omnitrophota bacterium]